MTAKVLKRTEDTATRFIGTLGYEDRMTGGIVKFLIEAEDQKSLYQKVQLSLKAIRKADPKGQFIDPPFLLEKGTL